MRKQRRIKKNTKANEAHLHVNLFPKLNDVE